MTTVHMKMKCTMVLQTKTTKDANLVGKNWKAAAKCTIIVLYAISAYTLTAQRTHHLSLLKTKNSMTTLLPYFLEESRSPLPCDACGFSLSAIMDSVYSCLLCNFMVHSMCIYLPRVIKLTRHPHRLSHTSSRVPSDHEFSCGVLSQNSGHQLWAVFL